MKEGLTEEVLMKEGLTEEVLNKPRVERLVALAGDAA